MEITRDSVEFVNPQLATDTGRELISDPAGSAL
jgi:hypothetical protein